jgi:hypothetical protein
MMAAPNLSASVRTESARNYNPFAIRDRRFVAWDSENPLARKFAFMGSGVRLPRPGDMIEDFAGVTVTDIERTADPERPAADGVGPGLLAVRGFAWVRFVGEVRGSQVGWERLDLATDGGDELAVITKGADIGAVRRACPGDVVVGRATCVDDGLLLVHLTLTTRAL